jgi:flagellar assembly protein FliH
MSSSSAERAGEHCAGTVLRAAQAARVVRAARLDRQLTCGPGSSLAVTRSGDFDRVYADPHLEELVNRAAQAAREHARAEGFAQGWADGRRAAAEAAQAEIERARRASATASSAFAGRAKAALSALDAASRVARTAMSPELAALGEAIADGALELASAALGRELAGVDAEVAEAVRTAMRALGTTDVAVVHVNPADLQTLSGLPDGSLPDGVRLHPDPDVPEGGALATSANRQVLAHLPSALARAREAMRQ